jgi:micrococcal nuclease
MLNLFILGLFACQEKDDTGESVVEPSDEYVIDDLSWIDPADLPAGPNPCREPIRVLVEWVFDGDTFLGQGEDGEEKVRVIGVNTPELSSDDCYAQEAKNFLIRQISTKWVWLTFDGECYDQYDRTLAYVHLGTNEQDFVERQILLGGYASAFPFNDTDTFEDLFAADEATAETNGAGGWSACGW